MRVTVTGKIKGRKGASITFALLIFLVCAVVGTVVLSAAVTASGRAARQAESDQRYYAVSSAAQLFCDALNGQTVTVDWLETDTTVQDVGYSYYKPAESGGDGEDTPAEGVEGGDAGEGGDAEEGGEEEGEAPAIGSLVVDPGDPVTTKEYKLSISLPGALTPTTIEYTISDDPEAEAPDDDTLEELETVKSAAFLADAALSYIIGNQSSSIIPAFVTANVEKSDDSPSAEMWLPGKDIPSDWLYPVDGSMTGGRSYSISFSGATEEADTDDEEIGDEDEPDGDAPESAVGEAALDFSGLDVDVRAWLLKDGSLVIRVSNHTESGPVFTLDVTMVAVVHDNSSAPIVNTEKTVVVTGSDDAYTETTTTVKTVQKETSITWKVGSVKKAAAEGAGT